MDKSSVIPDWLVEACNDYPLLWAVYGLLLFLPVALVIYMLCAPKRLDTVAHHKKTDENTPADTTVTEDKSCDLVKDDVAIETVTEDTTKYDEIEATKDKSNTSKEEETKNEIEAVKKEATKDESEVVKEKATNNEIEIEVTKEKSEAVEKEATNNEIEDKTDAQEDRIATEETDVSESHNMSHDNQNTSPVEPEIDEPVEEVGVVSDEGECRRWSFPPVLDQFDLMETDTDPSELEDIFNDERLREIYLDVSSTGPGLGISIVGGQGSPSGDLPIIIKRVLPGSLAEQDGRLKSGDELVAMNEKLLVGVGKDVAINALSNLEGAIRLLVLQDE